VTSGGLFTAATDPSQAGGVPVSATAADGNSALSSIAVTGAFPGLVNRTNDYLNFAYDPKKQRYLQHLEGRAAHNFVFAAAVSQVASMPRKFQSVKLNALATPLRKVIFVSTIKTGARPHILRTDFVLTHPTQTIKDSLSFTSCPSRRFAAQNSSPVANKGLPHSGRTRIA